MRKLLISLATAASALSLAAPASAQWARPTPVAMDNMQARVQDIRQHVRDLSARGIISYGEARHFDREAARIDREIWGKSRHGLSYGDRASINAHIERLRQQLEFAAHDGRRFGYRR